MDKLTQELLVHRHEYDGDCGRDLGCNCGVKYPAPFEGEDYDEQIRHGAHAEHLAEVVRKYLAEAC